MIRLNSVSSSICQVLLLSTVIYCGTLPDLPIRLNYPISRDPNDIKFYLYPNNGNPKQELIFNDQSSVESSAFNANAKTVFIVHGFTDNGTIHINSVVPQAYLASPLNYNYIVVDWDLLSGNEPFNNEAEMLLVYTEVVAFSIRIVANRLASFIQFLNIPPAMVHIVGHSLGAHVSGNAGQIYHSQTSKKLARISGLDPAGPLFTIPFPIPKINYQNAKFVDITHTNMGGLGDVGILGDGHATFYPNGGVIQPGCAASDNSCSHQFVTKLYAASISKNFTACKCIALDGTLLIGTLLQNCLDNCPPSNQALFGENCPTTTRGLYSLKTSATP